MRTKFSAPVLDIKELSEDGGIAGYGSVFGNRDHGGDIVVAGAFAKSLAEHAERGTSIKMFWQHDQTQPIGRWTEAREDGKGLYVAGRLNMGVQRGREAHALLKAADIDGLSIGYQSVETETDKAAGALLLKEVRIHEVSVVSMPMNAEARVDAVKAALEEGVLPSLKDFEKFLREAGFSKTQAVAIASHGLSKLLRSDSEGDAASRAKEFLMALRG